MIVLDFRDKRPIYEQVEEKISRMIACGALAPGSKLPSVRNLAIDLSVNPNTIQRAYAQLEQDGYIYTVSGRGNFVANDSSWKQVRIQSVIEQLRPLLENAKHSGLSKLQIEKIVDEVWKGGDIND